MTSRGLKPLLPTLAQISSPAALKVLFALVAHADRSGVAWPSWSKIARSVGLSRRAVAEGIRRLEEAGLVERAGPAPRGRGVAYRITTGAHPCTGVVNGGAPGGARPCTDMVHAHAPMLRVHSCAPSGGENPHQSSIPADGLCQSDGARPCTQKREETNEETNEDSQRKTPAAAPPASSTASGAAAYMKLGSRLLEAFLAVAPMSSYCWLPAVHPEDLREAVRWLEGRSPEAASAFRCVLRSLFGRDGWKQALEMLRTEPVVAVGNGQLELGFVLELRRRVDLKRVFAVWTRLLEADAATKNAPPLQPPPDGGGPPRQALENTGLHEVPR